MFLKNPKDIVLDNEDDLSIKIFEISNYTEKNATDSILDHDDSDMKIFLMK